MQRVEPGSPGASAGGPQAELAKSTCRLTTYTICSPSARPCHSNQAESAAPATIANLHTLLNHGPHEAHLASLRDKLVGGSSGRLLKSVASPNEQVQCWSGITHRMGTLRFAVLPFSHLLLGREEGGVTNREVEGGRIGSE
jgi:hypothetical protein